MPWKITSLVRACPQLVELMLARRQPLPTLCRRFNVSRKTACQWRARFRQRGVLGRRDRSRRPRRSPQHRAAFWHTAVRQWHRRRAHWGAKKIRRRLRQLFPRRRVPAPGWTRPTRFNQVGTVDFKGWFRTADGQRQEPLTVRARFRRFGLCLRLLPSQDDARGRWGCRGCQSGGWAWASASSSPAGRGRVITRRTSSSMVVTNGRSWRRAGRTGKACHGVRRAG